MQWKNLNACNAYKKSYTKKISIISILKVKFNLNVIRAANRAYIDHPTPINPATFPLHVPPEVPFTGGT